MAKTLPIECEHGNLVDMGDFGECQDCSEHDLDDCPNMVGCTQCITDAREAWEEMDALMDSPLQVMSDRDALNAKIDVHKELIRRLINGWHVHSGPDGETWAHPRSGAREPMTDEQREILRELSY